MKASFAERQPERRTDPILATVIDVAIAYRENLDNRVAEAFMRETGVPDSLVQRVLERSARQRASLPRRRAPRAVHDLDQDRRLVFARATIPGNSDQPGRLASQTPYHTQQEIDHAIAPGASGAPG